MSGPRLPILLLPLLAACCSRAPEPAVGQPDAARWRSTEQEILDKFPAVEHLGTEATARLIAAEKPLILDVRRADEFAISHLPGARNIPLGAAFDAAVETLPRDRPILIYCSVGYRSAMAADQLRKQGHPAVHNYLGSIFAWANAGRGLVNAQGPTDKAHPYDEDWGQMLRRDAWQR